MKTHIEIILENLEAAADLLLPLKKSYDRIEKAIDKIADAAFHLGKLQAELIKKQKAKIAGPDMDIEKPNKKALLKFLIKFFDVTDRPVDIDKLKKKIDERWPDAQDSKTH